MRAYSFCLLFSIVSAAACDTTEPIPGIYCNSDEDCSSPHPRCALQYHACVAADLGVSLCEMGCGSDGGQDLGMDSSSDMSTICTVSSQCPDSTPICSSNVCRTCAQADDAECAVHSSVTPRCEAAT